MILVCVYSKEYVIKIPSLREATATKQSKKYQNGLPRSVPSLAMTKRIIMKNQPHLKDAPIALPDIPVVAINARQAVLLTTDGEIQDLSHTQAGQTGIFALRGTCFRVVAQ